MEESVTVIRVPRTLIVLLALVQAGCAAQVSFQSPAPASPAISASLVRPGGDGPFSAVVLLHTCAGVRPHVGSWAQWLASEGYAALVVDSLSPASRNKDVCASGSNPTAAEVTQDAFGALAYLRSLPFIDRDRIAVMGFSYGGAAAMTASERAAADGGFRAAIAVYPGAHRPWSPRVRSRTPLLVLVGDRDFPSVRNAVLEEQRQNPAVTVVLYPGVDHGFDQAELGARTIVAPAGGYTIKYDSAATKDAERRIRQFLGDHLGRHR